LIYAYAQTARNTQQHLCEGAGDWESENVGLSVFQSSEMNKYWKFKYLQNHWLHVQWFEKHDGYWCSHVAADMLWDVCRREQLFYSISYSVIQNDSLLPKLMDE
jgi:hypothetical protein